MRIQPVFIAAIFSYICIFFSQDCYAAVYKYLDSRGTPCFADNLQAIPEQYRASAVIVSGELKEGERDPDDPNAVIRQIERPATTGMTTDVASGSGMPFSRRLLLSILVIIISVMIYIYVTRVSHIKHKKKILPYVRMGLIGIACLSIVVLHARDVMAIFGIFSNEVKEARKASEEKGKKAAQFIKAIDSAMEQAHEAQKALRPADETQK